LSSEFSGVPEDSKFPLLGVWVSSSHLTQSGVATERNFKILEDVVDVMAETKWPVEDIIHIDANI
jgi:hypothetical protein